MRFGSLARFLASQCHEMNCVNMMIALKNNNLSPAVLEDACCWEILSGERAFQSEHKNLGIDACGGNYHKTKIDTLLHKKLNCEWFLQQQRSKKEVNHG